MDNNETVPLEEEEFPPLQFTEEMQYFVFEAAKWARILAIFGFVFSGILGLLSLTIASIFPMLVKMSPSMASIPGGAQSLSTLYFIVAALCFSFSIYLFQFAKSAKEGISYNSEQDLTQAFTKLKAFFKLGGVIVLIIAALYIVSIFLELLGKA